MNSWTGKLDLTRFDGDGTITQLGTNRLNSGYEIAFESFQLSEDFEGRYTFSGVPPFNRTPYIRLQVSKNELSIDELASLDSVLSFSFRTTVGDVLMACSAPINSCTTNDSGSVYAVFFGTSSGCANPWVSEPLKEHESYVLEVKYEAKEGELKANATPTIRVGGVY